MKTLYHFYIDGDGGEVFTDEAGNYVGGFASNDAHWREEYMQFIPKFFGGRVVCLEINLSNAELAKHLDDGDLGAFVQDHRNKIITVIAAYRSAAGSGA